MAGPRKRDPGFSQAFGANLARCREARGISQEDLGFLADLHRTAVGQLERGERVARSDTLLRLCGSLDVSAEELFAGLRWTPARYTAGKLETKDTNPGKSNEPEETKAGSQRSDQPAKDSRGKR